MPWQISLAGRHRALSLAGWAGAYFFAHQIAFFFPSFKTAIMMIWPAAGVGLAAFLLSPRAWWPALTAALFAAGVVADVWLAGRPLSASVGYMTANMTESLTCAWLILGGVNQFRCFAQVREILALIAGAIVINAATACLGAETSVLVYGANFWRAWSVWYISDGFGLLLLTPFIVAWLGVPLRSEGVRIRTLLEAFLFLVVWALVSLFAFDFLSSPVLDDVHPYVLIGPMVWAGLRLGLRSMTFALLLLFVIAMGSPAILEGPSDLSRSVDSFTNRIQDFELFLAFVAIVGYLLNAAKADLLHLAGQLRQSEAQAHSLFEVAAIGMGHADVRTGRFLRVNRKMAEIAGYTPEELYGLRVSDITHPDDRERDWALFQQVIRGETSAYNIEKRYVRKDGREVWVRVNMTVLRDEQGNPIQTVATVEEISQRREMEESLRRSERKYRELVEHANSIILHWTRDGLVTFLNEYGQRFFGYTEAEIVGRHVLDTIVPAADSAGRDLRPLMDQICANPGQFEHNVNENMRRNGERVWIAWTNRVALDEQGQVVGILSVGTDITPRKLAEEALRESQTRYQSLVETLPQGIFRKDREGRFTFANAQFAQSLGRPVDQIVGRTDAELCAPDLAEKFRQDDQFVMTTGSLFDKIVVERGADGQPRYVHVLKLPLRDSQGNVVGVQGVVSDVSGHQRMVEALRKSEQKLKEAQRIALIGSWECSLENGIHTWSEETYRIYGVDPAVAPTVYPDVQRHFTPESWAVLAPRIESSLAQGVPYQCDAEVLRPDGTRRWVTARGEPVRDAAGRVIGLQGTIQDITDRKENEVLAQRWQHIFQAADFGISLVSLGDNVFLDVNLAYAAQRGYTRAELIGRPLQDIYTPEYRTELQRRLRQIDAAGQLVFEAAHLRKNGSQFPVLVQATIIKDHQGRPLSRVAYALDITARKQAEESLRRSEKLLSTAVELARLGHWEYEVAEDRFIFNDQFYRLWHTTAEAVGGYTMSSAEYARRFVHPDDVPSVGAEVRQAIETTDPHYSRSLEHRIIFPDGSVGYISVRFFIVKDEQGRTIRTFGVNQDITDRKRAEETHARLATAIEQAAEAVVITDLKGAITYVNPSFEKITGYSASEVFGQNPRLLKSGKMDAKVYEEMWQTLLQGQIWKGQLINRKKDGRTFVEHATITPLRDPQGVVTGYVAVKHDLTKEAELEAHLRQAQKLDSIGQLAGGVAHDFNNMLAATMVNLSLLREHVPANPATEEILKDLTHGAKRAAELTRQLLLFSRRSVLETQPLDLNDLLWDMLKMLKRIIGEHITIHTHFPDTPAVVEADAGMIEQVLLNLTVNARDAMPQGGALTLSIQTLERDAQQLQARPDIRPGSFRRISVTDTGCGMDQAVMQRIFEPFFTTKDVGKGTGLGLATVHGIVAQHKGWVEVESQVGRGSTFHVYLPAAAVAESAEVTEASVILRGTETILLVEDEDSLRRATGIALRRLGYAVLEAENGPAALDQWSRHRGRIELLLSDMVMPGEISGLALADQLRKEKPGLKIIISSGYHAEMSQDEKVAASGMSFFRKPYALAELSQAIRQCLDRR